MSEIMSRTNYINYYKIKSAIDRASSKESDRLIKEYCVNDVLAIKDALANITRTTITTPIIDKVIFNPPATIILWKDGSKTVVKCTEGEQYDPATGFAMAFVKKLYGNTGGIFRKCQKEYERQLKQRYKSRKSGK